MKVRVVDYVANLGGGVRFAAELLQGLAGIPGLTFELVSSGEPLERYRTLLQGAPGVGFVDIPPEGTWRHRTLFAGIPGAGPLNWALGTPDNTYEVPRSVLRDCDRVWLPWVHRHRVPARDSAKVVASLHDTITLDFPHWFGLRGPPCERRTLRGWLASDATIAVSSRATEASLQRLFGIRPGRVSVVPLSGQHAPPAGRPSGRSWPFAGRPYLLCPANHSRHKNHDVLLEGAAGVAPRHPLVLTGHGMDIFAYDHDRSRVLLAIADRAGLVAGESVFGVGYVDDPDYQAILDGAWALVMPTLAEGGGSFPVWEAMERGIPAVVSDIPVLREMMERVGGEVLWFDPHDPADLARALRELEEGYPRFKARAVAQVPRLDRRTWQDVAADYARLLGIPGAGGVGGAS